MPTVDDYANLVPFELEELVSAVNSILRDRPSMHIQGRTVRYYIANGLLPPPSGGPKFARYGLEHLIRIVSIRQWLDQGVSLDQAKAWIAEGRHGGDPETHVKKSLVRESRHRPVSDIPPETPFDRTVHVIRLSSFSRLEVDTRADLLRELQRASETIQKEIARLQDSF
ncbi:MAG: MerR family transcriptional regulator [Fimbriimonadaceae bacterium]|nr:MerR family transcriptional regulator [Fimbriimonadaceae bacterium]